MHNARISATWLSDEMACALAAMWPPLGADDVMRTADALTLQSNGTAGLHLLRPGSDRATDIEPGVVEALRALHDLVA